jgi:hypothetical protein
MSGVRVHLESTLSEQRHIGMAVSECVFNKLNPVDDEEHRLKFDYEVNDDIAALKLLARPVAEQETELKEWRERNRMVMDNRDELSQQKRCGNVGVVKGVIRKEREANRFGDGMVEATECSDTDRSAKIIAICLHSIVFLHVVMTTSYHMQCRRILMPLSPNHRDTYAPSCKVYRTKLM